MPGFDNFHLNIKAIDGLGLVYSISSFQEPQLPYFIFGCLTGIGAFNLQPDELIGGVDFVKFFELRVGKYAGLAGMQGRSAIGGVVDPPYNFIKRVLYFLSPWGYILNI